MKEIMRINRAARAFVAAFAALVFASAAHADVATGVWTTGTWETFTAAKNNLLRPKYLATDASNEAADVIVCDGYAIDHPAKQGACIGNNRVITWKFPCTATISGFRFYTYWGDSGRDAIKVNSIDVKYSDDGEWVSLASTSIDYNPTTTAKPSRLFAGFAAVDGSPLAEDVVAMRIVFAPTQENGDVQYAEIEALGTFAGEVPETDSDYVWTAGGFDRASCEPLVAESNMMSYCSAILKNGNDVTTSYGAMIDKSIAQYDGQYINNGDTITFMFNAAFNLQSFSVFAGWHNNGVGNAGRDSVAVLGFETLDENNVWTKHFGPFDEDDWCLVGTPTDLDTADATVGANYGTLRRKDGTPIATGVCGIRVYSLYGDSAGACWYEVEAEGWVEAAAAIFDERSVTTATDCWDVTWTAKLASLGASDKVTVNLWTSLDNSTFTLADTKTVTEADVAYEFKKTFDDVGKTISYRFETINSNGETTWYTTNTVASVVNYDNATYYWREDGASGKWEDAANWTNSRNDSRLKWPSNQYTTADFSGLTSGASTEVEVLSSYTVMMKFPSADGALTLKGGSTSSRITMVNADISGCVTFDGMMLTLNSHAVFGDGARLTAKNNATIATMQGFTLHGEKSGIELLSGATMSNGTRHSSLANNSEIVVNGGSITDAGYIQYIGNKEPYVGRIVFGPLGGVVKAPKSHSFAHSGTFTLRYELPGGKWTGYEEAPLQPTKVNDSHQFGLGGSFHVEVVAGEDTEPVKELELPLIELPQTTAGNTIITNDFTFAAFGTEMVANVRNSKGDYFYWTYDGGDSRTPATEGTLPSGLRFHHASRSGGMVITVR